jgi:hypothetical protein
MQETIKTWKMRNTHCRTWNIARNSEKPEKMRHIHCRTWSMARNTQKHGK